MTQTATRDQAPDTSPDLDDEIVMPTFHEESETGAPTPVKGLARPVPKAKKEEIEDHQGAWTTSESEAEHVEDDSGQVTGTERTTEGSVGVGRKHTSDVEMANFDGTTHTASSEQVEVLAGAEAAYKRIMSASPGQREVTIEAAARAGVFGSAAMAKSRSRGPFGVWLKTQANGGAGVQIDANATAKAAIGDLMPDLETLLSAINEFEDGIGKGPSAEVAGEAGVKVGAWGDAAIAAGVNMGPLIASFEAQVAGFVGAEATVSASAGASIDGIEAAIEASVFAGARAEAKVAVTAGLGPMALEVGVEGSAQAGAAAEMKGTLEIGLSGVSLGIKASAEAGAKATGAASGSIKVFGKRIVTARAEISVSVGVGVEFEGELEISSNRIRLMAGLGGTLGIGAGALGELDIDVAALAEVIAAQICEYAEGPAFDESSPAFERKELDDEDPAHVEKAAELKEKGHDAVYDDFVAYYNNLVLAGNAGTAEQAITIDGVQGIIKNVAPLLRTELAYVETDRGIEAAAKEAFAGELEDIQVQAGVIRQFQLSKTSSAAARAQVRSDEKQRAASETLRAALAKYALEKSGSPSKHGVKKAKVEAIVTKNYDTMNQAHGATTDQAIAAVLNETLSDYAKNISWSSTSKTVSWTDFDEAGTAAKQGAKDKKASAAALLAQSQLARALKTYRAGVVAAPAKKITAAEVQALTAKHVGTLPPSEAPQVSQVLSQCLQDVVTSVSYGEDRKVTLEASDAGLTAAREASAKFDHAAAHAKVVMAFSKGLTAYHAKALTSPKGVLDEVGVAGVLTTALGGFVIDAAESDALDNELNAAAAKILGRLATVEVIGGELIGFTLDTAALEQAKANRKRDGVATLAGGDEADNERRRLLGKNLSPLLGKYASEMHAKQAERPLDPKTKVTKEGVQKVVDSGIAKFRADVANPTGDEAIHGHILEHLPEIDPKTLDVTNLVVRTLSVSAEGALSAIAAAKRAASPEIAKARSAIMMAIKKDVMSARGGPTKEAINAVLATHTRKIAPLMTPAELDDFVSVAVSLAVGDAGTFDVQGGRLTAYRPKAASAPMPHRPNFINDRR